MPFFKRDGIHFHYMDGGRGVPLLFQHGLGSDVEKIFTLIKTPPGFRLLGMDARAHGKTTPLGDVGKLLFNLFADDVIALLDHLQVSSAIIGGTSMGAGVALNCALRYPQRLQGLVLLRPAWLDAPNARNANIFGLIARLLREHGAKAGLEQFRANSVYSAMAAESSDSAASLLALFEDPRALETVAKLEQIPADAPNRDRKEWGRISVPTLVLANRQDPIHPFEFGQVLAREIPGAQLQELTPKSVDLARYTAELREHLASFLQTHFAGNSLSPHEVC